ncbi:methionine--tRNA ligase [Candidatus Woesearchaeota archaeon]|nr:methionine--tRNA ligase [Candidatus Woesearchaeota archaeon]
MKKNPAPLKSSRSISSKSSSTIITAALPYANGPIHIGHLLEYIQADIYSRFLKLTGNDALYICASDMHGTPIEVNAQKANLKPEIFVERYWKEHQEDFTSFLIRFDNYYKTHSSENRELAELFYKTLQEKGHVYRKKIKVMYCDHCQRSLPDRYVKGTCPHCHALDQYGDVCEKCGSVLKSVDLLEPYCSICKNTPRLKDSEHYFFKLSAFTKQLQKWFASKEADLQPEVRNWLRGWFEKGLEDWCISRDAPYFGFEIPNSKEETGEIKYFYVWLDAPIGYISSTKNYCDKKQLDWKEYWYKGHITHFIGKDIAYFHLLFWPAMLMDMGIVLPRVNIHGFITVNGEKMSKSRGTFLTAKDFLKLYSAEALRFYYASHLDRSVVDVDLHFDELKAVVNNVLLGNLGNFCYRTLIFTEKNYGKVSVIAEETDLQIHVSELLAEIKQNYENREFKSAVKNLLKIADQANAYFQKTEPWKAKDSTGTLEAIGFCVNLARNLAIAVSPILPVFSQKVYAALGEKKPLFWKDISFTWKGKVGKVDVLVEKIEEIRQFATTREVKDLQYAISPDIKPFGVKVRVAQLTGLTIKKKHEGIERLKSEVQKNADHYWRNEVLEEYRKINQKMDLNSNRYPNAVQNLLSLIKEKGKLPQINTVVDIYNALSVESSLAMATHDLAKIDGKIVVRVSTEGELFTALDGTTEKLKAGEVIYADNNQVLGRFSKQCQQTITTPASKEIMLIAFGNSKITDEEMNRAFQRTCELITKYNGGEFKILNNDENTKNLPTENQFPIHLAVGLVEEIKDHPNADSLYLLNVNFGPLGIKQVITSLKKVLSTTAFQEKKLVFCVNLKPSKFRGKVSEAMILGVDHDNTTTLFEMPKSALGETVVPENMTANTAVISSDDFAKIELLVKNKNIVFESKSLGTSKEKIIVKNVKDGTKVH